MILLTLHCIKLFSHMKDPRVIALFIYLYQFAATACGNVFVMLNGSVEVPFSSKRYCTSTKHIQYIYQYTFANLLMNCMSQKPLGRFTIHIKITIFVLALIKRCVKCRKSVLCSETSIELSVFGTKRYTQQC